MKIGSKNKEKVHPKWCLFPLTFYWRQTFSRKRHDKIYCQRSQADKCPSPVHIQHVQTPVNTTFPWPGYSQTVGGPESSHLHKTAGYVLPRHLGLALAAKKQSEDWRWTRGTTVTVDTHAPTPTHRINIHTWTTTNEPHHTDRAASNSVSKKWTWPILHPPALETHQHLQVVLYSK